MHTEINERANGLRLEYYEDGKRDITNEFTKDPKAVYEKYDNLHFNYEVNQIINQDVSSIIPASLSIRDECDMYFDFNISTKNKPTAKQIDFVKRIIKRLLYLDGILHGSEKSYFMTIRILRDNSFHDKYKRDRIYYSSSCYNDNEPALRNAFCLLDEIEVELGLQSFGSKYKIHILCLVAALVLVALIAILLKQIKY